jgi:ATP-dependent protease ClpP protease subunit
MQKKFRGRKLKKISSRLLSKFAIILAGSFLSMFPVAAAEITSDRVGDLNIIAIEGELVEGDVALFRRFALENEDAMVLLSSPGGSLAPSLQIGEIVRLKGFKTYVPDNVECTSACALIWLAGSTRYLASTARVGFHASYYEMNGQQIETGLGNAMVGRYLTLLNLPEDAVIFATSAAPNEMQYLTPENAEESGISFEPFNFQRTSTSSTSETNGTTIVRTGDEFEWQNGAWAVSENSDRDGCVLLAGFDQDPDGTDNASVLTVFKTRGSNSAFLAFFNQRFTNVVTDNAYDVLLFFTTSKAVDNGWGTKQFKGAQLGAENLTGYVVELNWDPLKQDLLEEYDIAFFVENDVFDSFPLDESPAALTQFDACLG